MQVKSSVYAANEHVENIKEKVESLCQDPLIETDNVSTISACNNMKQMYFEEQKVTGMVINDIEQEQKNLSSIANDFSYWDTILSKMLSRL